MSKSGSSKGRLGILPTVATNPETYRRIFKSIADQSLGLDMLAVVFQGSPEHRDMVGAIVRAQDAKMPRIHVIYSSVMSLAHAKNSAVEAFHRDFRFVYIYEDDVSYPPDYNERMMKELLDSAADIISCVERRDLTLGTFVHAAVFRLSHPYPFKDLRYLFSVLPYRRTVASRYLSGGLTLIRTSVFREYRYDQRLLRYSLGEDMDFSYRASCKHRGVLTNKITCLHESRGIRKYDSTTVLMEKMVCWVYFYKKNLNRLRYVTPFAVLLGAYFLELLWQSIHHRTPRTVIAWIRNLGGALHGRYASSFIIAD
jgi:GT2 family glycosyltransferase